MSESPARQLESAGYGESAIHRIDARAKILATLALLICVASFPKYEVLGLLPFIALPLALGVLGKVPTRPVVRLVLAASPFALLVGLANPLLDTAPAATFLGVPVSGGALSLASILVRFLLATSAVLVLVATTPVPALVRAASQMGLPRPLAAQILMLHRYLFLLVDEGRRLGEARLLRQPARRLPDLATARRMLSSLLIRTWERGERIYLAMKVRGFDGSFPALVPTRFGARDAAYLLLVVGSCVLVRVLSVAARTGAP